MHHCRASQLRLHTAAWFSKFDWIESNSFSDHFSALRFYFYLQLVLDWQSRSLWSNRGLFYSLCHFAYLRVWLIVANSCYLWPRGCLSVLARIRSFGAPCSRCGVCVFSSLGRQSPLFARKYQCFTLSMVKTTSLKQFSLNLFCPCLRIWIWTD